MPAPAPSLPSPRRRRRALAFAVGSLLVGCALSLPWGPRSHEPLRQLGARAGVRVGAAVEHDILEADATYRRTFASEFDSLTPANAMKWERIHPEPDRFAFGAADALVAFAERHGMEVRGHTLVWHLQAPDWLWRLDSAEALRSALHGHIRAVVGRYRGRVRSWDVVNEAVRDDGRDIRDTAFSRLLGAGYLAEAFRIAHEADPDALLYYNDYSIEGINPKSDRVFRLLEGMLRDGVPVHGLGLQMHLDAADPPPLESLRANLERFLALGLYVDVTEMDVRVQNLEGPHRERLDRQARLYRSVIELRLGLPRARSISFWGFSDAHSWIDTVYGEDDPLLLDESYRPKPAYFAVAEALGKQGSAGRRAR